MSEPDQGNQVSEHAKAARADELHAAVVAGLGAVGYLAMRVAQTGRTFEFLAGSTAAKGGDGHATCVELRDGAVEALQETLGRVDGLMQFLGDYLNSIDGVSARDQKATEGAFAIVKRVRAGKLDEDDPDEDEDDDDE